MTNPQPVHKNFGLRLPDESDAPDLARHANDPSVAAYLTGAFPSPYTIVDAINFIHMLRGDTDKIVLVITVRNRAAGCIGLHKTTENEIVKWELGYWLGRKFWNRGIATAAVGLFAEYIQTAGTTDTIYARVYRQNVASIKVLEKNGFIFVYEIPGKYLRNNKPTSELVFLKQIH